MDNSAAETVTRTGQTKEMKYPRKTQRISESWARGQLFEVAGRIAQEHDGCRCLTIGSAGDTTTCSRRSLTQCSAQGE